MSYRAAGKQKTRKIGEYPEVGLAAARADLDRFRAGIRETASSGASGKPALGDTWDEVAKRYMQMRAEVLPIPWTGSAVV